MAQESAYINYELEYKALLKKHQNVLVRSQKFTKIQQSLITANNTIDKKLELYKRINYYTKKIGEAKDSAELKSYIPEALIDCFGLEGAMVSFQNKNRNATYSEGLFYNKDEKVVHQSLTDILREYKERKPVYLDKSQLVKHPSLGDFDSILVRKFESKTEGYQFYILGFISKKHASNYTRLNEEEQLVFDNFSEQVHTTLRHRLIRQNLIAEKEKYRSIIANMNLGLLEVNMDGKILMANHTFCKMVGYEEQELLGKVASDLFLKGAEKQKILSQNKSQVKKQASVYEVGLKHKDGSDLTWMISGAPNYDLDGNVIGSIWIHLDITAQKLVEQNLFKTNLDLKKINSELDTFIYRVSHDLRTPLLSIISIVELIKLNTEIDIGAENKEFIDLIEQSAKRLDDSIKEILSYSKNSRLGLQFMDVNIPDLVRTICKDLQYINRTITFDLNCNGIEIIKTDKMRIETVLKNLLSNAVKYQKLDENKPRVSFTITENQNDFIMTISDNGIGMVEDNTNKMFDMFYRGTSKSQGTGLGLFIVKEMIEKLNGNIDVESEIDVGTTFTITIPKHK